MITAIYIDAILPTIPGMKTLDDFTASNWFYGLPATTAVPYAGFYFGTPVSDLVYNSYNPGEPGAIVGSVTNTDGFITVNPNNYFNTNQKATQTFTVCGVAKRNAGGPSLNAHMLADFAGTAATAQGFSIGFAPTDGRLFIATQNEGQSTATYAYAAFPSSIAVGDLFAFTASVSQGAIAVDIYNPSTMLMVSGTGAPGGTRTAGVNNVLLGRKTDNNTETTSKYFRSAILMDGLLTTDEKIEVSKYLVSMG